jgi:LL-diaminopimelate aminotransferase
MSKIKLNKNFDNLAKNYLFSEINRRVMEYKDKNPNGGGNIGVISLGIGDVTQPLTPCVVSAMQNAVAEMGDAKTFRGYPPEGGYPFTKTAIASYYKTLGVELSPDDIFVDCGAKNSLGGLTDIFGRNEILITDPVYPAYVDGNIIAGRKIKYLSATADNDFLPRPDEIGDNHPYIIYLCSPNNPTGSVYNRKQLTEWVDFAVRSGSLIIFDSAYSAFISGDKSPTRTSFVSGDFFHDFPRSILEIDGAKAVAIEVNSLSKSCGFTNLRCSWTIIANAELNNIWKRRQSAKFNGVPYIIQRGAEMALSPLGIRQCQKQIKYYKQNAKLLADFLASKNMEYYGGENSPYIWWRCPNGESSWAYFDKLLNECEIVVTPGAGFGKNGEGFVRLSAFAERTNIKTAIKRLQNYL